MQGARVGMWWQEQAGIDMEGTRDMGAVAAEEDKDGL